MSKTAEQLNALKSEVESLNAKLAELTDEEMLQVFGGSDPAHPDLTYWDIKRPSLCWTDSLIN